jgi:hypothetical protein
LLLFFWIANASAQTASDAVKAIAGDWEISNADRDRICTVALKAEPVRSAFRIEIDPACAAAISAMSTVEAWTASDDAVRLLDARGRAVFQFSEVESGMYEAERTGEGIYFMQNLAAAGPAFRTPDEMAGNWSIMRGKTPICAIALLRNEASGGPEGAMALRIAPGCDTAVAQANFAFWRMDQGELVLSSADETNWRFAQEDSQSPAWKRVPFRSDSLTIVKK